MVSDGVHDQVNYGSMLGRPNLTRLLTESCLSNRLLNTEKEGLGDFSGGCE